jgi:hypothetical protein
MHRRTAEAAAARRTPSPGARHGTTSGSSGGGGGSRAVGGASSYAQTYQAQQSSSSGGGAAAAAVAAAGAWGTGSGEADVEGVVLEAAGGYKGMYHTLGRSRVVGESDSGVTKGLPRFQQLLRVFGPTTASKAKALKHRGVTSSTPGGDGWALASHIAPATRGRRASTNSSAAVGQTPGVLTSTFDLSRLLGRRRSSSLEVAGSSGSQGGAAGAAGGRRVQSSSPPRRSWTPAKAVGPSFGTSDVTRGTLGRPRGAARSMPGAASQGSKDSSAARQRLYSTLPAAGASSSSSGGGKQTLATPQQQQQRSLSAGKSRVGFGSGSSQRATWLWGDKAPDGVTRVTSNVTSRTSSPGISRSGSQKRGSLTGTGDSPRSVLGAAASHQEKLQEAARAAGGSLYATVPGRLSPVKSESSWASVKAAVPHYATPLKRHSQRRRSGDSAGQSQGQSFDLSDTLRSKVALVTLLSMTGQDINAAAAAGGEGAQGLDRANTAGSAIPLSQQHSLLGEEEVDPWAPRGPSPGAGTTSGQSLTGRSVPTPAVHVPRLNLEAITAATAAAEAAAAGVGDSPAVAAAYDSARSQSEAHPAGSSMGHLSRQTSSCVTLTGDGSVTSRSLKRHQWRPGGGTPTTPSKAGSKAQAYDEAVARHKQKQQLMLSRTASGASSFQGSLRSPALRHRGDAAVTLPGGGVESVRQLLSQMSSASIDSGTGLSGTQEGYEKPWRTGMSRSALLNATSPRSPKPGDTKGSKPKAAHLESLRNYTKQLTARFGTWFGHGSSSSGAKNGHQQQGQGLQANHSAVSVTPGDILTLNKSVTGGPASPRAAQRSTAAAAAAAGGSTNSSTARLSASMGKAGAPGSPRSTNFNSSSGSGAIRGQNSPRTAFSSSSNGAGRGPHSPRGGLNSSISGGVRAGASSSSSGSGQAPAVFSR